MTTNSIGAAALSQRPWRAHAEVSWWGMVLLCMTEGALFAYLFAAYFYLGVSNPAWPPADIGRPSLKLPLVMTVLLVSSSVALYAGVRALEQNRRSRYRAGTGLAVLLGLGFVTLQSIEYRDKLQHAAPATHAYASLFYTITGLHGMHVLFGMLLLLWTLGMEMSGRLTSNQSVIPANTSLYWHFVDGVWLVVLTVLYISPRMY